MMGNKTYLKEVYYSESREINGYKDIFLQTSSGILRLYGTTFRIVSDTDSDLQSRIRLTELDTFKNKYGDLYITEIRKTYDNDIYILLSEKLILAIEYNLNSNFENSIQEFRFIEDIYNSNKAEFDNFKELDIIDLSSLAWVD